MLESKKVKFGVVVSHKEESQGAVNKKRKITEHKYSQQVANNLMIWNSAISAKRKARGTHGACIALSSHGCNSMIEIHGNAYDETVSGCEIVVLKGDTISKNYALELIEEFKKMFPARQIRRGNGIKEISHGDRGYKNLSEAKAAGMVVCMLTEFFFIDNNADWIEPSAYAMVIKRFIEGLR